MLCAQFLNLNLISKPKDRLWGEEKMDPCFSVVTFLIQWSYGEYWLIKMSHKTIPKVMTEGRKSQE